MKLKKTPSIHEVVNFISYFGHEELYLVRGCAISHWGGGMKGCVYGCH